MDSKFHLLAMLVDPRYKDILVKDRQITRVHAQLIEYIFDVQTDAHPKDGEVATETIEKAGVNTTRQTEGPWKPFEEAASRKKLPHGVIPN